MSPRRQYLFAALSGVAAAIVTLGIAEVVALMVAPAASPLVAVGSLVIDLVPPWVKDTAIALFGTGDKLALLIALGILVLILAVVLGIVQYRWPPFGLVGLGVVGLIATIAAVTRAGASFTWAIPTVVGTVAGALVLHFAIKRLHRWVDAPASPADYSAVSRRHFVGFVTATTAAAIVAGLAARAVNAANTAISVARETLKLPKAAIPAPPVPAGADLGIDGVAPLFTPNKDFYRIDTALTVPTVDTANWRLRIIGDVEQEVELTFDDLLALPLVETAVTLACVSNEIGGGLIGNASWLGYPIRDVLARAKPKAGADMVLSRSVDGFTASTPIEYLQDPDLDALFAVGMNGEPLPLEHGFPVRMVVPGLFGYVSATKWVTELKVTRFADETAYWTDRGWSAEGPIKIGSRIDVAKYGSGELLVAGVAWAQHTGISAVEVRVDEKDWVPVDLATAVSIDTWVQWSTSLPLDGGVHAIEVRAIDANEKVQSGKPKDVVPDGAEGWHKIEVDLG